MNQIYKKVFNKVRGCFVAVNETARSVSHARSEVALLVAGSLLLGVQVPVHALVTINGDVIGADSRLPWQWTVDVGGGPMLTDSVVINGDFTYNRGNPNNSGSPSMKISIGLKDYGLHSNTLTVNGNLLITNISEIQVAHRGNSDLGNINSVLHVTKNLTIDNGSNLIMIGLSGKGENQTINSSLIVDGTLYNKGYLASRTNSTAKKNTESFSINKLVNTGTVNFSCYNTLNGTFNDVVIDDGTFNQLAVNHFVINNSLTLNGGTLNTVNPLVVGQNTGDFIISKTLNLNGGALNKTDTLTQGSGTINVTKGSYSFGTFNKTDGSLNNSSTLSFTDFNQSNGTTTNIGNLTIGNSDLYGTLNSSGTLTLTGNVTTRGNLSSTGTLDNQGSWTENNAYVIEGTLNNSGTADFQNGFSFADGGKLVSTGTVKTTDSFNIFDSLGIMENEELHFIGLGASAPQEIATSLNSNFQKYIPGFVKENFENHADFRGGKVVITGVNLTETQRDDLKNAFKSKIYSPLTKTLLSALSHEWSETRIFLSQGGFNEQNFQENMESISGLFRCSQ